MRKSTCRVQRNLQQLAVLSPMHTRFLGKVTSQQPLSSCHLSLLRFFRKHIRHRQRFQLYSELWRLEFQFYSPSELSQQHRFQSQNHWKIKSFISDTCFLSIICCLTHVAGVIFVRLVPTVSITLRPNTQRPTTIPIPP